MFYSQKFWSYSWKISLCKFFAQLHRAHSHVKNAQMGIIFKKFDQLYGGHTIRNFNKLYRAHSHIIIALMGILKHVNELHRVSSSVRIALTGVILKHFLELHSACFHDIFSQIGFILKHFHELNRAYLHNRINWVFSSKFWQTSQSTHTCKEDLV